MKKLLLILLIFPLSIFSQVQQNNVQVNLNNQKSSAEIINEGRQTAINRAKAMDKASTIIKIPVTVDFNNYTHIALVGVDYWVRGWGIRNHKGAYKKVKELLSYSFLEIINPAEEDKKKFKENPMFLRRIKDPNWLYVYYKDEFVGVNTVSSLVIRDSKNKILYSAIHTNTTSAEIFSPLTDF